MISPKNKDLTIEEQCYALGLPRSTYYYKPQEGEADRNLEIMRSIDLQYTEHPAMGARQMVDYLKTEGFRVGRKLVRRLMRLMDIKAIYPMKNLSKGGCVKYRMPYLLRKLDITHPNQVWSTDISYVAMEHGFMYLYAIIDVYSRCIVGWGLYNTLDAVNAIEVLKAAIKRHGAPEIINSDQGTQYTSKEWLDACEADGIKISMDGRARCLDNIWIERFWRTIKREYIYLNPEENVAALRRGIAGFIDYYNNRRCHQGIGHRVPALVYAMAA
jgi:putative transposase